ncbi:uncharacterized protein F5147DRAFT_695138 [Suillus discolor]|uniref:NAD(P)-binding protein n=1 Tax=Suillus discolor TaxID=1912936 RepID=A0A9P7F6H6_9AGAM|nr:uncharacterized protein F5147DRAFT_695138 [Suillus discolor]KAG2108465.1 hypothetical protein F5147DRAFT_695138 [Suillus discolor]
MSSVRPLFVVAGIGNGTGTGAATARLFAKSGYRVALISRGPEYLNKPATEISQAGGEVLIPIHIAGYGVWKPFLDITEDEVRESIETNILAAFAFAREALLEFTKLELETANEGGVAGNARKRGTLIFTGATASIRGNVLTSAFSASKFGIRALSQSLAKEFAKKNIHYRLMRTAIITDRTKSQRNNPSWEADQDVRLDPDSIAKSYLHLVEQDSSAWTWEIDLRPAHEKW